MWLNGQLRFLGGIQDGIVFPIFQKMNNSQLGQFVSDEQEKDLVLRVLGAFCTAGATPQQLEGTYSLLSKKFYYHSIVNLFNIPILSLISLPYFLISDAFQYAFGRGLHSEVVLELLHDNRIGYNWNIMRLVALNDYYHGGDLDIMHICY